MARVSTFPFVIGIAIASLLGVSCKAETEADPPPAERGEKPVPEQPESPERPGQPEAEPSADSPATADEPEASAAPEAPEDELRANVQAGKLPNALDQTPAFEAQTRAPQPAEDTAVTIERVASGLEIPWGIAPLPEGRLLVTERQGTLRVVEADGTVSEPLAGVPEVVAINQGGLLDVAIGPDFETDRSVFFTYAEASEDGPARTAVARGLLSPDGTRLDAIDVLHRQVTGNTTRHFGSRLAFAPDGNLFVTFGDRGGGGDRDNKAQNPFDTIGAVIRIQPDGSIPDGNPFADGEDGHPALWSWGHRNIQSATIGADGALWTVEHGPKGGDELNRPEAGVNHGWPLISYGEGYSGRPVLDGETEAEGLAQPVYYWDPVIAPSGMVTYRGDLFEGWDGNLLIGGLQAEAVVRLTLRDGQVHTEEWIPIRARVRSLALAADGAVLVGTDKGEILALRPE